jgi:hypothetical protein
MYQVGHCDLFDLLDETHKNSMNKHEFTMYLFLNNLLVMIYFKAQGMLIVGMV